MEKTPLTILSPVAKYRHPQCYTSISMLADSGLYDIALVECFGFSEVARARNYVASKGLDIVRARGGLVFWLDADMVIPNIHMFQLHAELALESGKAISGRYVTRQRPDKLAASLDEEEKRTAFNFEYKGMKVELTPTLSGLGCLMMPASLFVRQVTASPHALLKNDGVER